MATLYPLAALTLLATASLSASTFILTRAVQRVVRTTTPGTETDVNVDSETSLRDTKDAADAKPDSLYARLLHTFPYIFPSLALRGKQRKPAVMLSTPLHAQEEIQKPQTSSTAAQHPKQNLVDDAGNVQKLGPGVNTGDLSNVVSAPEQGEEIETPLANTSADAPTRTTQPNDTLSVPRCSQRAVPGPVQRTHSAQARVRVDYTISWDDIWPATARCSLPFVSPHPTVRFTYNFYVNAFTLCLVLDPGCWPGDPPPVYTFYTSSPLPAAANPPDLISDSNSPGSDLDSDAETDMDAYELVSGSADEDLLSALHALVDPNSSNTSKDRDPRRLSHLNTLPPAGPSPFCPPPLPGTPTQSASTTVSTWRLDWY